MRLVRVVRKVQETAAIASFQLESADRSPLTPFTAGSHIDVEAPSGHVRQYSLCNDPRETHRYVIGVLREPASRGGSRSLHDDVYEGTTLRISDPKNHFALAQNAVHSLLFAGGIGITPILSMAEHLAHTSASFELHYCARSYQVIAFEQRIKTATFADRVAFHVDDGPESQRLVLEPIFQRVAGEGCHAYVCGPAGFMQWVLNAATSSGWTTERLHSEYFAPPARDEVAEAFEVQIASTGTVLVIPPDKTIIEVLAANGIVVPSSCEQGVCGTCLTRVIEGTPWHRDCILTENERSKNDQMTLCCSRSRSRRLVLDL